MQLTAQFKKEKLFQNNKPVDWTVPPVGYKIIIAPPSAVTVQLVEVTNYMNTSAP